MRKYLDLGINGFLSIVVACCLVGAANCLAGDTSPKENYPSFPINKKIEHEISIVAPLGNGTMWEIINHEVSNNGNIEDRSTSSISRNCKIEFDQGKIHTQLHSVSKTSSGDAEDIVLEVKENYSVDTKGNKIEYNVEFIGLDFKIPDDFRSQYEKTQIEWINGEFHFEKLGKNIQSGSPLKEFPISLEKIAGIIGRKNFEALNEDDMEYEIVEGFGIHNNEEVIVTSFNIDREFDLSETKIKITGGGYDLYNPDSFLNIHGEFQIDIIASTAGKDTIHTKIWGSDGVSEFEVIDVLASP